MCRLKLKIKLAGSKHHKFKKIVSLSRNLPINGKFRDKLGFWDCRNNNTYVRYINFNIHKFIFLYKTTGLTPNKKVLNILYYFFIANKMNKSIKKKYIKLSLEREIRQKKIIIS